MPLSELSRRVTEAIERVRREGSTTLGLWKCNLTEIPDAVFGLSQLEELDLKDNQIHVVPDRIRELRNLKRLSVERNPVQYVPDVPGLILDWATYLQRGGSLSRENILGMSVFTGEDQWRTEEVPESSRLLAELTGLQNLRLLHIGISYLSIRAPLGVPTPVADVGVAELIDRIGEFEKLEQLMLFGLSLGEFPSGIRNLKRLRYLYLPANGILRIPDWISELRQLSRLSIEYGDLGELPNSLNGLPCLTDLNLGCNRFSEIPGIVFTIRSLTQLRLDTSENAGYVGLIKHIPTEIIRLENLRTLDVGGQPIETPPPEVVEKGVEAIKNYWRQQQEAGTDYLCEAKVLIVGEAGAGKTSLARKIQDARYELRPAEISTEGIEIIQCTFRTALHVKKDGGDQFLNRDFRINMWDFGGQRGVSRLPTSSSSHTARFTCWWRMIARRTRTSTTGCM